MDLNQISINNLFRPDFNALGFSLLGMAIVFCGLIIISLYITLLPVVLNRFAGKKDRAVTGGEETEPAGEDEMFLEKERLIAIAVAYHLETNSADHDKITWDSRPEVESAWQISGRMHSLAARYKIR